MGAPGADRPDPHRARAQRRSSVATTRLLTEDRLAEVYLVLQSKDDWVRIRVPGRPNGRTGWVRRAALGPIRPPPPGSSSTGRPPRSRSRATGTTLFKTRVGVGKPTTPTPAGHFWVREKLRFKNQPLYGSYALGTAAYAKVSDWPGGGVVGIHGTDQPQLIPGRPSHGCIRVPNAGHEAALQAHAGRHADRDQLSAARIARERTTSSASVL